MNESPTDPTQNPVQPAPQFGPEPVAAAPVAPVSQFAPDPYAAPATPAAPAPASPLEFSTPVAPTAPATPEVFAAPAPGIAPAQPVVAADDRDTKLRLIAFIFSLISTIGAGWLIVPLAWMLPMTIMSYKIYKGTRQNTTTFAVLMLLFTNTIAGILLLMSKKDA